MPHIKTRIAARLRALAARLDPPSPQPLIYGPGTATSNCAAGSITITRFGGADR